MQPASTLLPGQAAVTQAQYEDLALAQVTELWTQVRARGQKLCVLRSEGGGLWRERASEHSASLRGICVGICVKEVRKLIAKEVTQCVLNSRAL